MRVPIVILRVLFGAAFTFFGLNGVLMAFFDASLMPPPEEMAPAAAAFFEALTASRFMMPLISIVQLASGVMILTGLFAALGLAMLAPIVVGIVLYHQYVDPSGRGIAYAVLAIELILAFAYGPAFRGMLAALPRTRWSKTSAK